MKRLEIGERVRARAPRPVPTGTLGRIHETHISALDFYVVRFDGEEQMRLMHVTELERVAGEGEA